MVSRNHNYLEIADLFPKVFKDGETVYIGKPDIENNDIGGGFNEGIKSASTS